MSNEESNKNEIDLFKWGTGILIGVLFTLVGIVYGYLKDADAEAISQIRRLQEYRLNDNARFQNIDSNIYLLCKSQRLNCIPPVKES